MADRLLSACPAIIGTDVAAGDLVLIDDVSANVRKKITHNEFVLSLEAGGADPITNLGLTVGGFLTSQLMLTDGAVGIATTDAAGLALGNAQFDNSGFIFAAYDPTANNNAAQIKVQGVGWGGLSLSQWDTTNLSNLRDQLIADGTAFALTHYDSAGGGVAQSALVLGEPGSSVLAFNLADGSPRVTVKDDGTGVTLNDSAGGKLGTFKENTSGHALLLEGFDANEVLRGTLSLGDAGDTMELSTFDAASNFRNDISVYDDGMEFSHYTTDGVAGAKSALVLGTGAAGSQETSAEIHAFDTNGSSTLYSASFNDPTHGGMQFNIDDAFITIQNAANSGFQVSVGTSSFVVDGTGVGFFGQTPAAQSAAGSTAADAIACLKAFGLMAAS